MRFFQAKIMKKTLLIACFLASLNHSAAFAVEEVTVQDTSGFTRATSSVDGTGSVEFNVATSTGTAADGATVTLTNAATGEVLTGVTTGGVVTFQGVVPGVWTVATTSPGLTFTSVVVASTAAAGAGLTTAAIVPAVIVGGGGAGAAIAINNAQDSNNDEISPSS
jgi:hypothetical protein